MPVWRKARLRMEAILSQRVPDRCANGAGVTVSFRLNRRPSGLGAHGLKHLGVEEPAENLLLARLILRNRDAHPSDVHEMLYTDVLAGDVAAPCSAAQTCRHRHPVRKRAGICPYLRLANGDSAN